MRLGGMRIGLLGSAKRSTVGAGSTAPVLTGPLDVNGTTGEATFTVDRACQIYWMLSAGGTTPTAAEIAAGTGAIEGTGAVKAMGNFAATLGSVQMDVTFPVGINVTGAVLSVVARVEPSGAWSNVLRDTSVDVETLPLSATFVSGQTGATPDFGTLAAGWYLVVINQRNGTITSITPPSQSAVTTKLVEAVPTPASGIKPCAMFLVELTSSRSGAWTIGHSSGSSWATALYSLSAQPQVIGSATDFKNFPSGNPPAYALQLAPAIGDVLVTTFNAAGNPPPSDTGVPVTQNYVNNSIATSHSCRVSSGTAVSAGTQTVLNADEGGFSYSAALAIALRRAA